MRAPDSLITESDESRQYSLKGTVHPKMESVAVLSSCFLKHKESKKYIQWLHASKCFNTTGPPDK